MNATPIVPIVNYTYAEVNKWKLTQSAYPDAWVWMRTRWECPEKPGWGEDVPHPEDWALWRQTQYHPFRQKAIWGVNMRCNSTHKVFFSPKGNRMESYLCNMAIASLVLSWSRPKVKEKRRASSLMPQKEEDERSKLGPRSDSISLKSCTKQMEKNMNNRQNKTRFDGRRKTSPLTCCKLRMSVFAHWILSICLVLLMVSLIISP